MWFSKKKKDDVPKKIRHLPIGIQLTRATEKNPKLILGPFEWATLGEDELQVHRMRSDDNVTLAYRNQRGTWSLGVDWVPEERHMIYFAVTFFSWNPDNVSDFPVE